GSELWAVATSTRLASSSKWVFRGALMGGLIRDNITDSNAGVPLLKDIPGIGFLFGRQKAVKTREEVIMLIQPYVLESDADAREVTEKLRAMLSKTLACSDRPGACRME
ncbi:hypothetical protein QOZ82_07010, partial [Pseudomonas aeruginosa]